MPRLNRTVKKIMVIYINLDLDLEDQSTYHDPSRVSPYLPAVRNEPLALPSAVSPTPMGITAEALPSILSPHVWNQVWKTIISMRKGCTSRRSSGTGSICQMSCFKDIALFSLQAYSDVISFCLVLVICIYYLIPLFQWVCVSLVS